MNLCNFILWHFNYIFYLIITLCINFRQNKKIMFYSTFSFDEHKSKNLIVLLIEQTYVIIHLLWKLSNCELYQFFVLKSTNIRKAKNHLIYIELLDSFFGEHLLLSDFLRIFLMSSPIKYREEKFTNDYQFVFLHVVK